MEVVAEEFEKDQGRKEATTYAEYIEALRHIMRKHMVRDKGHGRASKKPWWDGQVAAAWQARRNANRVHRRAVRDKDSVAAAEAWDTYLQRKHEMQAIVQAKMADANLALMKNIRTGGKSAAQKFWRYVSSLDRGSEGPAELVDTATSQPVADPPRHITDYLTSLYGPPIHVPEDRQEETRPPTSPPSQSETTWEVTPAGIKRALGRIGMGTATGPDGIPARILKLLGPGSREQLAELFNNILHGEDIPEEWRDGRVVLLLKHGGNAAHICDYRALTVTSVVYRVFMQVLKAWISGWAETAGCLTELQNGFRPGRRLEDNLFVLTSCIDIARKEGRRLICCFLDVEKAYDHVPHAALFDRLGTLGLAPLLLDTIRRLYVGNTVTTVFGNVRSERVTVQKGLRQGCPLSPLLYLLYVSGLEKSLLQANLGFGLRYSTSGVDDSRHLPGLAYADDLVLMGEDEHDVQRLLNICSVEIQRLGLRFNQRKSMVVQLAGDTTKQPVLTLQGEQLTVATSYKYLGVTLCTGANMYELHEAKVRQTALRAQCILRRRCLWGCNRYVMVRDLWKLVHVPGLTFANAVICLSARTREWLERRQREVGRTAVGCHGAVANEAIQGDLGWSSFEAREASSKLSFRGRLLFMARERWARRAFEYLSATCVRTKWVQRVYRIEAKCNIFSRPIEAGTAAAYTREVRSRVQDAEEGVWRAGMEGKETLGTYRQHKTAIGAEKHYDNSIGSKLLFEARAGALGTQVYRRRYDSAPEVQTALCRVCGAQEETIEHIVLQCPQLPPHPREGATLPVALGFVHLSRLSDDSEEASDGTAEGESSVRVTKRRLTQWWAVAHKRVKASD
ncbi:uncharacterized protein LOC144179908 [Haemaphysalis longicornis]